MGITGTILYALMVFLGYLLAPATLVWGWARWRKQRPLPKTISAALSFIGLLLASTSALLALSVIGYGWSGGFEHTQGNVYYSPNYQLFYRCVLAGEVLSLAAIAFALGGVFRRSSIRWQAPVSAVGVLAFWLYASTWP